MGQSSSLNSETSHHGTSRSVKAIVFLQAIVIGFLSYWAIEEYQNNVYFQSYVNSTVQANMLALGMLVGIPIFAIAVYGIVKVSRRSGRSVSLKTGASEIDRGGKVSGSGVTVAAAQSETRGPPPGFEEMAMKFLKQAGSLTGESGAPEEKGKLPVLERTEQIATPKAKVLDKPLPFLERVESRQERVGLRADPSPRPVFPASQRVPDSLVPRRDMGYSPSSQPVPRSSGPIPGPTPGRPGVGVPMTRPSTVVTGIIGQGPRPLQQRPQIGPSATGSQQGMQPRPLPPKWSPGVRPENLGGVQRDRTLQGGQPFSPGSRGVSAPTGKPVFPVSPPPLGRVGPPQSAREKLSEGKPSPEMGSVEPVDAIASKLPWSKLVPESQSRTEPSPQQGGVDLGKPLPMPPPGSGLEGATEKKQPGESSFGSGFVPEDRPEASDTTAGSSAQQSSTRKRDDKQETSQGA